LNLASKEHKLLPLLLLGIWAHWGSPITRSCSP